MSQKLQVMRRESCPTTALEDDLADDPFARPDGHKEASNGRIGGCVTRCGGKALALGFEVCDDQRFARAPDPTDNTLLILGQRETYIVLPVAILDPDQRWRPAGQCKFHIGRAHV